MGRSEGHRNSPTCYRSGCARAGRHRCDWFCGNGTVATSNSHYSNCVHASRRSSRRRFVDTLAQPGGNATGFIQFEYTLSGKWLELLKEIAPGVKRAAVLRDAAVASGVGQFAVIQAVASSIGIEVSAINVRDTGEIERA